LRRVHTRYARRPCCQALLPPFNHDGFVKTPNSLLRFILSFFNVRPVRLIAEDLRASPIL